MLPVGTNRNILDTILICSLIIMCIPLWFGQFSMYFFIPVHFLPVALSYPIPRKSSLAITCWQLVQNVHNRYNPVHLLSVATIMPYPQKSSLNMWKKTTSMWNRRDYEILKFVNLPSCWSTQLPLILDMNCKNTDFRVGGNIHFFTEVNFILMNTKITAPK